MSLRSSLRSALSFAPLALLTTLSAVTFAVFFGGGFRSILAWLALQTLVPAAAFLVLAGTLVVTLRRRRGLARLGLTAAVSLASMWPAAWLFGALSITYPYSIASSRPAATVRLPTDAPMIVLWGGDDHAHNYHAAYPDQRWAYDLAVEPTLADSARLEDYGCYGVPVVAPTSARVHLAHDGEPDETPGRLSGNVRAPLGNHVVLALDGGGYLVLAHLRRGSVVAREGDRVAEGAPLGACGNSGNTSEPHLHVHVQRQDPRGRPVGFSEGLPLYFRDHGGAPMPRGGIEVGSGRARATGDRVAHGGDRRAAR